MSLSSVSLCGPCGVNRKGNARSGMTFFVSLSSVSLCGPCGVNRKGHARSGMRNFYKSVTPFSRGVIRHEVDWIQFAVNISVNNLNMLRMGPNSKSTCNDWRVVLTCVSSQSRLGRPFGRLFDRKFESLKLDSKTR